MYFTRKIPLTSRKQFSHLSLLTLSWWQCLILQRQLPHPSAIKSTNSPSSVPTLPFILSLLLFKTNTFPLYHRSLSHGSLSQGICSVMISFFCCITSSLFLKKKKEKKKLFLKHNLQEQSLQLFNKSKIIPKIKNL